MVFVHVRNSEGRPLSGVHVVVSGAATRDMTTDFEGIVRLPTMADGAYHVRFDREGFVSLEQDLTLKAGQPEVVNVVLDVVPAPPPAPPPPPAPEPAPPPPAPPAVPAVPPPTDSEQRIMSIPDFLAKNFIGRENLKESTLGCTGTATTRLIQVKDTLESHAHTDVDEALYVVAGEGTLNLSGRISVRIGPGSLGIVPRGARHSIERKGKNPLILLSTQSGAPCAPDSSSK
jgi:mannose-6-phosphate isomerase-like protein (cupin superfamily)